VSLAGDVKSETYARALVDLALTRFGGLDIAFNNAGTTGTPGSVPGLELAQWQETLDTNLTSAFVGAKYQIPAMQARGGGSLIFTSTFVGHTLGLPGMAAYAREQGGPHRPDPGAGRRIWGTRVRVNALLPGGTDTPMGRAFTDTPESLAFVQNMHALKRLAQPEEIARSALYLASDASSFTTGIALLADGGVSICRT
jgi:NAD(P)-dependent dehydrogenase (short-subunit alcohol dehydrogenase family)